MKTFLLVFFVVLACKDELIFWVLLFLFIQYIIALPYKEPKR